MEVLIYIIFGAVVISLLAVWIWAVRTVAKTTLLLNKASAEVKDIAEEVKSVAKEFIAVSDSLDQECNEDMSKSSDEGRKDK